MRPPLNGLAPGKIPARLLEELLAELPPGPPEVLVGPRLGEDGCAIELPGGVLVAATDPVTFTADQIGRWSVVVNANDVAVSGARPRWFLAVVLVPPGTAEAALRDLFAELRHSLAALGAYLVGGHTEVTSAVTRPVVVGQMLGLVEAGAIMRSAGAVVGDVVVQVRPVPIEGAAVLAREAARELEGVDPAVIEAARVALERPGISVVEAALLAKGLGATALHDPTEGGLAAGLHEIACAAGVRIRVDRDAILWFEPGLVICRALGADPWSMLASGGLLAVFPSTLAEAALAELAGHQHAAAVVGVVEPGSGLHDIAGVAIPRPDRDEVARLLRSCD